MPNHPAKKYRSDIQILRALAVLAVLLFHVDLDFAAGGYLGVDIFFVISGFLITRILYFDLATGKIGFREFYLRRIRRLLPASVVTIAFTLFAAYFLFSSQDFMLAGRSALAALFSLSNFVFWRESGYFDTDAYTKPLLHTWSLGVEEQFYLLWPIFIWVMAKLWKPGLSALILVVGLASLAAAQFLVAGNHAAAFFLVPFRVFEFCAGALLCFLPPARERRLAWIAYATGIAIMLASIVILDGRYPMPGLYSLIPVGGAAMSLHFASGIRSFPDIRPLSFLGDISYSLYLVHWPLIVFYKYRFGSQLTFFEATSLLIAALVLGWLSYRFIEVPMRRESFWRTSRSTLRPVAALGMIAIVAGVSLSIWTDQGWPWRLPPDVRQATAQIGKLRADREAFKKQHARETFKAADKPKVLIIGDSHGQDLFTGLYQNGVTGIVRLHVHYRCQPVFGDRPLETGLPSLVISTQQQSDRCDRYFKKLLESPLLQEADVIILASRWKSWAVPRMAETIKVIKKTTEKPIIVFGPQVEFDSDVPTLIQSHGSLQGADRFASQFRNDDPPIMNDRLKQIAVAAGVNYVDKFEILCGVDGACPVLVPDTDTLFIWDYGHWTLQGARYFVERLSQLRPEIAELFSQNEK